MKKTFFLALCICLTSVSCEKFVKKEGPKKVMNDEEFARIPKTKIEFNKTEHDFGTIEQGEIVSTIFEIKNVGDKDLLILDAHGSCGCTVPEVTKDPIEPGDTEPIKVTFDSSRKTGDQLKTVTIKCNTENFVEQVNIKVKINSNNR